MEPESLQDLLGSHYDEPGPLEQKQFWNSLATLLQIPEEALICNLSSSEEFFIQVFKFLLDLPFNNNSNRIISLVTEQIDPSPLLIRAIIQDLVPYLETDTPCLSSLNVCLSALKHFFKYQTPLNPYSNSCIQLYGAEDGMEVKESVKWPFEKGGTLVFWYNMEERTKECKILQILFEDRIGLEIILKNRKLYVQKVDGEVKFRLIKNTSAFLCEALYDTDVKLCLEFETKKKFFHPHLCVNVIMNNFIMTGIELDTFPTGKNLFKIAMLKNFYGKFYSCLFLTEKMAQQVEELNSEKGFVDENDIRNFTYLFEDHKESIMMMLSAIRSHTIYTGNEQEDRSQKIEDELHEPKEVIRPVRTILYDVIGDNVCLIGRKACRDFKITIRKESGNYGGFATFLPFLDLLEICRCGDELYIVALQQYLQMIKYIFLNRTDSIEHAQQISFFKILSSFLNRTRLQGLCYETISKVKEIYITLNTRAMREKFLRDLVWGVDLAVLEGDNLMHYVKFIKTFYNEDLQSSLQIFGVSSILGFITRRMDTPNCCYEHTKQSNNRIKKYPEVLNSILEIIQNILLVKRVDEDLPTLIKQIFITFGHTISPCYIESLIRLIESTLHLDSIVYKVFSECVLNDESLCKLYLYKGLSCCSSWKTKGRLIQLIFKMLGIRMFDETTREKEMLTLCARYPTMNLIRSSSIKSQENRDSVDFSEDKLSLNSASMHHLMTISPIETEGLLLLNDHSVIDVISEWTFSEEVLSHVSQEVENPGLLILMELYKGSTYSLRVKISSLISEHISMVRFSPELMSWAIECLLMAEFDSRNDEISREAVEEIKESQKNFYSTINNYEVEDEDENNELSIIKLVFTSVKSKYPDDITKIAGNKIFFTICLGKVSSFLTQLREEPTPEEDFGSKKIDHLIIKVLSNVFTFISEYFVLKGDDNEADFEEEMMEVLEEEMQTILQVLETILEILVIAAVPGAMKMIDEANAENNQRLCLLLFCNKDKVNFMALVLQCVQNAFDFFEDVDVDWKKRTLILMKKYLIFMIEVTENSGSAKLDHCEEELKQIFLNCLGFLEYKFHQYYFYPFEKHKNLGFQIENRIRKNIEELHSTIFNIFTDLIELNQFLDEKGSAEHQSFYELMKKKRKAGHKHGLKHIYPPCWKKADEQIIEFLCLNKETLRKEAREKLQIHISERRILNYAAVIEKRIAKKISDFVEVEKKEAEIKEKKSVNYYKTVESQKCRIFSEREEELTIFRLKILEREQSDFQKYKEAHDREIRELNFIEKKMWNDNRTFGGFWENKNFYSFCQCEGISYDNSLKNYYKRVRSRRQTPHGLMPFIKIQAVRKNWKIAQNVNLVEKNYLNEMFLEGCVTQKTEKKKKKNEKIKMGLQYLKQKVLEKLVRTSSQKESSEMKESENYRIVFEDVFWVKPMKVCSGYLKIDKNILSFCHCPNPRFEHISLLDAGLHEEERLIREWDLLEVEGWQVKKFLLKQSSVQIIFKTGKTLFLSFYASSDHYFHTFLNQVNKYADKPCLDASHSLLTVVPRTQNLMKSWDELEITEKWLNYELSNFEYLMWLNIASGRNNSDLNQYHVFPWIFSQYRETKFKKNESKYRDLEKPMGFQGTEERISKFKDLHQNIVQFHQEDFPVPHFFGFHYSNICIVLQYLVRLNPYSEGAKRLQGGKFDIPDRLFYSLADSHRNAISEVSDVRELIPQFFYFPEFLINCEEFELGVLQNGNKKVNHIELPDGCFNPFDFIELHREALECKEVSLNLHKWIDLIFGYKNSGKEGEAAMNTYHYLTNENYLKMIEETKDVQKREAMESQMAFYGKTPSQLFSQPHPAREEQKRMSLQEWIGNRFEIKFVGKGRKEEINMKIKLLEYSAKTNQFVILYNNGKGYTFRIQEHCLEMPIIENQFTIDFNRQEGMNLIDPYFEDSFPAWALEGTKIVVGGMWGGKFLAYDILNETSEVLMKHSATVTAFTNSEPDQLLWSGSSDGELCKWTCVDRIFFLQKAFLYSQINCLSYCEDLKSVIAGSEDGGVGIVSGAKMEIIRIIKVAFPIHSALVLKYPYFVLYIQCREDRQFCFSINGNKLEEASMDGIRLAKLFKEDSCREKVIAQVGQSEIVFLKMTDFSFDEKIVYQKTRIKKFCLGKYCNVLVCTEDQIFIHYLERKEEQKNVTSNGSTGFLKINSLWEKK